MASSKEKLSDFATKIFDNTKGHPIMVKFYFFGNGLKEDIEDRYYRYLIDVATNQPDLKKDSNSAYLFIIRYCYP